MVRPAARATDARHLALLGVGDARHRLAVTRVGAGVAVVSFQAAVPALLQGLQPVEEELRARLADRALTEVLGRVRTELRRVEAAVVEDDRLAGRRLPDTGEAGRDVAADRNGRLLGLHQ